jgi:hypothetical protein
MSDGVKITGFNELKKKLETLVTDVPEVVCDALWEEANMVMNDSKKQVPVDTGYLRNTGYVNRPYITSNGAVSVEFGYWAEYATPVHELPNQHVQGNWHFLYGKAFSPLDKRQSQIPANIIKRVNKKVEAMSE